MKKLKYLLLGLVALALAVVGVLFFMENQEEVTVNYLLGTKTFALYWVVLGSIVLGAALGTLATIVTKVSLRWHKYESAKKIKKIEKEVHQLKTNPGQA